MSAAAAIVLNTGLMPTPMYAFSRDFDPKATSHPEPTVFVVDDDIQTQQSLEVLIRSQGWRPQTCDSDRDLLARPRPSIPSCLILSFSSADSNSLEIQKRIARECPELPIIVVADYEDISTTVEAMKAGAVDFFMKPIGEELLLAAIRQSFVRSRAALDRWKEMHELRNCHATLSPREQQVLALVVTGLLNKQVGAELGISEITVKAHRGRVMQKMRASSFPHLVRMASKLRIARPVTPIALSV
jgi:FixJ family two-component response regulator